jgi:hypothetical protein
MRSTGDGWSDETAGPGGLAALCVAELHLGTQVYLTIRESFWMAWTRMMADPEWHNIRSPEDAKAMTEKYL